MRNHFANQGAADAARQYGPQFQARETAGNSVPEMPAAPVYSEDAVASLRFMIQEEKLAGDLYVELYEQTGLEVFARIAGAEDRHMASLISQAERAGIDVSDLAALPVGSFLDAGLQATYAELLAVGSVSAEAALNVGRQVESADLADLAASLDEVAGTPLVGVYEHLQTASGRHLAAFDQWLAA